MARKASPPRIGVIASCFNPDITERLLESCVRTLRANGVPRERIATIRVPGAYDIPWAAHEMARTRRFDALIALGAIVRGQTSHNDHIAAALFPRLHDISLSTRIPCALGVITPNTYEQGLARTRGDLDRGREVAEAALALAELRRARPWERP